VASHRPARDDADRCAEDRIAQPMAIRWQTGYRDVRGKRIGWNRISPAEMTLEGGATVRPETAMTSEV
jgi:hypothetical protein